MTDYMPGYDAMENLGLGVNAMDESLLLHPSPHPACRDAAAAFRAEKARAAQHALAAWDNLRRARLNLADAEAALARAADLRDLAAAIAAI
jgi:hypothetical protein